MALSAKSEGDEERSLRDDLASTLKDIEEREAASTAPEDEGAQAPEAKADPEAADSQSNRGDGRDAHGRFVKKGGEDGQAVPDASTQPSPEQQVEPAADASGQAEANQADAAPKSWRADEAKVWSQLPPEAKAVINRREAEAARLAGANDAERMFGREFAEIVRPHMETINSFGVSPQFAVRALLDNDRVLRSGTPEQKQEKALQLVRDYGLDLNALVQAPQASPEIAQLRAEIAQLRGHQGQQQQRQFAPLPPSAEEGNILSEIEAFRADPAHPHFDAVSQHMGKLLETGAAPDLESAYQAAVAMTPALRSTAASAPAANPAEKTAAARRASASVTGSPGPAGNPTPMSLRDELAQNLREAGFSV